MAVGRAPGRRDQGGRQHPTQQNVIDQTNRITDFTAGGITALVDWTNAHTTQTFPVCPSFVQVKGNNFDPVVRKGHQVFICFGKSVNLLDPVPVEPRRNTGHLTPCA